MYRESKQILEMTLNEKENTIILLSREKYELQSKLDIEKTKLEAANINSSTSFMNNFRRNSTGVGNSMEQEIKKLILENVELKKELENIKNIYEEEFQESKNVKFEYQNIISLQIEKIKKCEIIISEKNVTIEEINKKLNQMYDNWKAIDMERQKLENQYIDALKEIKIKDEKISDYEEIFVSEYINI